MTTRTPHPSLERMVAFFASHDGIRATVKHQSGDIYWVESLELPGCFASGDNLHESLNNFLEAIFDYFEVPQKRRGGLEFRLRKFPQPERVRRQEIQVGPTRELAALA